MLIMNIHVDNEHTCLPSVLLRYRRVQKKQEKEETSRGEEERLLVVMNEWIQLLED